MITLPRPRLDLSFLNNRRRRLRWQTRLVVWSAAALAGLAVVGFASLAESAMNLFFHLHAEARWAPFVLAPAVGMVVVWATRRHVPAAAGSGIPQVVAATRLAAMDRSVESLLGLKVAVGKVLLGTLALAGGFSAGREGPSVQVAASVLPASGVLKAAAMPAAPPARIRSACRIVVPVEDRQRRLRAGALSATGGELDGWAGLNGRCRRRGDARIKKADAGTGS